MGTMFATNSFIVYWLVTLVPFKNAIKDWEAREIGIFFFIAMPILRCGMAGEIGISFSIPRASSSETKLLITDEDIHNNKQRTQIMMVTTCMDMALKTLFKIIRARWDIENSIFNNLKRECGLDHCFVHGGNAVEAVLYLIFVSSNIM